MTEAFRPGVEGWVDEGMALNLDWDFDVTDVRCSVTWWHGDSDANAPLAPVQTTVPLNDPMNARAVGSTRENIRSPVTLDIVEGNAGQRNHGSLRRANVLLAVDVRP